MIKDKSKAPDFNLPSTNGEKVKLKDLVGKFIVLYFYPKNDTPGCTLETNDFNKLIQKFKRLSCEIYGISKDNIKSHYKFREQYKIKFHLLSDEELKIYLSKIQIKFISTFFKSTLWINFVKSRKINNSKH